MGILAVTPAAETCDRCDTSSHACRGGGLSVGEPRYRFTRPAEMLTPPHDGQAPLRAVKTGQREMESIVRLSELTTCDRDLLRDALRVVKQFREAIRYRYHLGLF